MNNNKSFRREIFDCIDLATDRNKTIEIPVSNLTDNITAVIERQIDDLLALSGKSDWVNALVTLKAMLKQ